MRTGINHEQWEVLSYYIKCAMWTRLAVEETVEVLIASHLIKVEKLSDTHGRVSISHPAIEPLIWEGTESYFREQPMPNAVGAVGFVNTVDGGLAYRHNDNPHHSEEEYRRVREDFRYDPQVEAMNTAIGRTIRGDMLDYCDSLGIPRDIEALSSNDLERCLRYIVNVNLGAIYPHLSPRHVIDIPDSPYRMIFTKDLNTRNLIIRLVDRERHIECALNIPEREIDRYRGGRRIMSDYYVADLSILW